MYSADPHLLIRRGIIMVFIGICGASGSGKSTLAAALRDQLGENRCLVLEQDCYYTDHSDIPFEQRALLNYDEPSIFDHDLLLNDVKQLLAGRPITRKAYDYPNHRRNDPAGELVFPKDVIIIEGIHTFYDSRLRDLMFLKLYMKVEPEICLLRRITRDINERGRAIDNISRQYLETVKPMFDKYIKGYVQYADVIVANGGKNARVVDILAGYVRDALTDREKQTGMDSDGAAE